jgi:WD40 repeat protein
VLATAGAEGTVILHDARTNDPLQELTGHSRRVYCMAFNHDGSLLITGSIDQTANVWDVRRRVLVRTFREHRATVAAIACDASGDRVATASADNRVLLWSVSTGAVLGEFRGHLFDVHALAAHPDGHHILSGDWSGVAKIWEWDTEDVRTLRMTSNWIVPQVYQAVWSPEETMLTCGSNLGPEPARFLAPREGKDSKCPSIAARRVCKRNHPGREEGISSEHSKA